MLTTEFFVSKLKEEVEYLKGTGLQGVRSLEDIQEQIGESEMFTPEVVVIRNNQVELVFVKKTQEIEFRTTYSNQLIDREYMNMVLRISQIQAALGSLIKSIIHFS
ncbi:hypothetical protein [Priestia megaterium]|uniref:hypothetical protein n=1 Tax=Priestia megaterium TaxID=1404 RepID=UPI000BEC43C8|nr:hypothetical protein [Priestia megaterium]PED64049.1 hypothetical protein CON20_24105 [Priestia megaterium]